MPWYCFFCEVCKRTTEVERPMSRSGHAKHCDYCGSERTYRDRKSEQGTPGGSGNHWRSGWASQSMGVGIDQVKAANREAARRGLNVRYDEKTGKAVATSRTDRNAFLKAHQVIDCDGGYGDHTGD